MILYNLTIRLYAFLIYIFSFFNSKAKKFIEGRKNIWDEIKQIQKNEKIYWFHCASLGEFDQGLPLMKLIKSKEKDVKILVTFFSPSGMENYSKRNHCADYVFYLPIDTNKNAKKFLKYTKPQKIFFIKYEFWLNYIFNAHKKHIPLYSVSCILRQNQHFFKSYGKSFRKGLKCFKMFFVQNEETKDLLNSIGIHNIEITGDTRYDKVIENKEKLNEDDIISEFLKNEKAIILGSSWAFEEEILSKLLLTQTINDKIIIAPHDISENHIKKIEQLFIGKTIRYSNFSNYNNQQILLIDCIGKLANAYQYGKFAFVGGGFTGSLHNILEPIVFGLPTVFGPKHSKFPEAAFFIAKGIANSITNEKELFENFVSFTNKKAEIETISQAIIVQSKGGSIKILERISD